MLLAFKCPYGQIEPASTARGVTDQWCSAGGGAHIVARLERSHHNGFRVGTRLAEPSFLQLTLVQRVLAKSPVDRSGG